MEFESSYICVNLGG